MDLQNNIITYSIDADGVEKWFLKRGSFFLW